MNKEERIIKGIDDYLSNLSKTERKDFFEKMGFITDEVNIDSGFEEEQPNLIKAVFKNNYFPEKKTEYICVNQSNSQSDKGIIIKIEKAAKVDRDYKRLMPRNDKPIKRFVCAKKIKVED